MSLADYADPAFAHGDPDPLDERDRMEFLRLQQRAIQKPRETAEARPRPAAAPPPPPTRVGLSVQQYLRHMDDVIRDATQKNVMALLVNVSQNEIEELIQAAARAKGRYFACLLDLANVAKTPTPRHYEELIRLRTVYEELELGIEALREAVGSEIVQIRGLRR